MKRKILMSLVLTRNKTKLIKMPSEAKVLFNLLENIKYGEISILSPEGKKHYFKGQERGVSVELEIFDWTMVSLLLGSGDIGLGERYKQGMWSCSDIADLIQFGSENQKYIEKVSNGSILKIIYYQFKHWLNKNTKKGSQRNIHEHYDIGNDFYQLWLDKTMTYSSAYFTDYNASLQVAQEEKYKRILNYLDAKEGEHIVEIGCGWGGFIQAAIKRNLKVTAVTLSKEQYDYCCELFKDHSMVDIQLCDYRDLSGTFDYIVSIEMFEAIGEQFWSTYFNKVRSILKPTGKAVIQTITINDNDFSSYKKGSDFIQQMIFPGGMLPCPRVFKSLASKNDLTIQCEDSFGLSYAETLKRWDESYQKEKSAINKLGFDEEFHRLWHFYLKYCEGGFKSGKIDVNHYVLS